jgi:hypothetical protein
MTCLLFFNAQGDAVYGFPLETLLACLVVIQHFLIGHPEGGKEQLHRNKQYKQYKQYKKRRKTKIPEQ